MKNKAPFLVLIGAIVFGLLAAVSVTNYLANTRGNSKLNLIIVARIEIPLGSKIVADQLTTVQMPQSATPEGTFDDVSKVVGRIAATRISAREAVINTRLAPVGSVGGLSAIIPEGQRAMTVKVDDDSGMSGFVLPGTYVDVAAVVKIANLAGDNTISKIILQNIKVLASGDNLDEPNDKRDTQKMRTVTLLVLPDQAEKLLLASTDGRLRLVMRNGTDQVNQPTLGANVRTLLTGEGGILPPNFATNTNSQPNPTPAPATLSPRVRRANPAARLSTIAPLFSEVSPNPAPAPARPPVEFFEGTKKRSVEFPDR
jgi:pilus assembly protein CpaB